MRSNPTLGSKSGTCVVGPRPNLFIVGAAKAGTTSLFHYFRQHPHVFTPRLKEPHWAAADLQVARPQCNDITDTYLAMFEDGAAAQFRVDASPDSLLSTVAAQRIHDLSPEAQIVILLRNPVETIPALHDLFANRAALTHRDLRLALEEANAQYGKPLDGLGYRAFERYLDVVDHAPQVRRYLEIFPHDQVHVILLDDLQADTAATWQALQLDLGLPPVDVDLTPRNTAKRPRSTLLHSVMADPPFPTILRRVVPKRLASPLKSTILVRNLRSAPRPPLPPDLESWLRHRVRPMVTDLEAVIGRDLSPWK